MKSNDFTPQIQIALDECLPLIKALAKGRYAVSIGGSHGRGIPDRRSDIDFRLFCDEIAGGEQFWKTDQWQSFSQVVENWNARGITIDHCWPRTIDAIDAQLNTWLSGQAEPLDIAWTVWGYYLLTDLNNQLILDDPDGIIATWQARLATYPPHLQRAIVQKHMTSLNYWRSDYHYRHKVERGDVVFLASITARLVHDMMQILFAINKTYYVGDGNNLHYATAFPIQPKQFAERVRAILYPPQAEDPLLAQYKETIDLIDELTLLANPILAA